MSARFESAQSINGAYPITISEWVNNLSLSGRVYSLWLDGPPSIFKGYPMTWPLPKMVHNNYTPPGQQFFLLGFPTPFPNRPLP